MIEKYWKDYWELYKHSGRFCKDHWKGVLVVSAGWLAVIYTLAYLVIYRDEVKDKINKIKNKFHKEEEA